MKTSEKASNVMKAIFNVQQAAGAIQKASTGQVGSRAYKYADLEDTWETAKPLMAKEGLAYTQSPTTGDSNMGQFFSTTIYHIDSGEWIQETMQMSVQKDDPQGIGSAITYYRRYMLTSMLGLVPKDDDNDAKDHSLATPEQKRRLVGAVKQINPDISKNEDIIQTILNITGKYPGNIREGEAEDAINLILAFK